MRIQLFPPKKQLLMIRMIVPIIYTLSLSTDMVEFCAYLAV